MLQRVAFGFRFAVLMLALRRQKMLFDIVRVIIILYEHEATFSSKCDSAIIGVFKILYFLAEIRFQPRLTCMAAGILAAYG